MKNVKRDFIRSFISIAVEARVLEKIRGFQAELIKKVGKTANRVSWVKPETIHLTIKFLGDIPVNRINSIITSLQRAADGVEAFALHFEGLGVFPNFRKPRVIWIGISKGIDPLQKLHLSVEQELTKTGIPREKKKFSGHLTLGRIRTLGDASALHDLLLSVASPVAGLSAVRDIRLMKSELRPSGAVHTELGRIPLS
jgi:2'-5' RNA ligase